MVRGGRNFGFGGFKKLLVSLVDELRNLATNQVAGIGENLHSIVAVLLDGSRDVVLLKEHARLGSGGFEQIETVIAEPIQRLFVRPSFYFGCHFVLRSRLG